MENENYIKMILALPDEFFENWEWNVGDKFYHRTDGEIYLVSRVAKTRIYGHQCKDPSRPAEFYNHTGYMWEKVKPLPGQEQIQEMIKKHNILHNVILTDLEVLERVVGWHVRRDPDKNQNKCSKQMYLEVLMWLNDKLWDGEKWI